MTAKVIFALIVLIIAALAFIIGSRTKQRSVTSARPSAPSMPFGYEMTPIKKQLGMEAIDLDVVNGAMLDNQSAFNRANRQSTSHNARHANILRKFRTGEDK